MVVGVNVVVVVDLDEMGGCGRGGSTEGGGSLKVAPSCREEEI